MINYSIVIRSTKPGTKTADITETKAYGVAQVSDFLTLNDFARHIAQHGTLYGRDVIQGVLVKMVDCMRELLLEGKKIQLGDLGSFGIGLSTKGANTAALFTAENIKKVNVNWERGKLFKNLRDDATFNLVPSRKAQEDALADAKRQETLQPEEEREGIGSLARICRLLPSLRSQNLKSTRIGRWSEGCQKLEIFWGLRTGRV